MTRKNRKLKFLFLLITATLFFSACSKTEDTAAQEEIVIHDHTKTSGDEIVITNNDVEKVKAATPNKKFEDYTTKAPDGSKIATAFDSFGNKSETRCFNSSRINCLVMKTLADGTREAQVFGQNGLTKNLPENMLDRALTASADEIADSVRIYAAFKATRPVYSTNSNSQPVN
jgi:hypothetical protein